MAEKKYPGSNLPIRKTQTLLPQIFQTEANNKFMSGVVDPFVQPGTLQRTVGYVGRRFGTTYKGDDIYLDSDATLRSRYQLEPGVTVKENDEVEKFFDYLDFKNQIKFFGNVNDRDDKITDQEHYSWNPPIDWDKLINYREYFWLPLGPPKISIAGQRQGIVSTYRVNQSTGSTWIFSPDGFTNNPNITLYRGQTYNFIVNSPGEGFVIRTNYDTGSLGYNPNITYEAGQFAVFDGKLWKAKQRISPDDGSSIDTESQDWELVDSNATYSSFDYNQGVENNGVQNGTLTFTVPLDAPDILFYQSNIDPNRLGRFVISDVEDNTLINVESEILGKTTYTSSNDITLSNGMLIEFSGSVLPESYQSGTWLVEGVGTGITLTNFEELVPPNLQNADPEVLFDGQGFDTQPFDDADAYPSAKDYIVINRSSNDLNPWSRYNRWFHRNVIETSYQLRGQDFDAEELSRAKRPIIEFKANLKLFNHGTTAKNVVDYIDDFTSDIFSIIEGEGGYNVDSEFVFDGARILFTNDTDSAVNNKIYEVQFITHNNKRQIHLAETDDSDSQLDDVVFVRRGATNAGKMFWFDGTTWQSSQEKTKTNQAPLFELFDENSISFGDTTTYPVSTFVGSKIFSYRQGTGPADSELGFPISYLNINNVGDIQFDWNFGSDSFVYSNNDQDTSVSANTGYFQIKSSFENGWIKTSNTYIQPIIDSVVITENTNTVELNTVDWDQYDLDADAEIVFFKNGLKLDIGFTRNKNNFTFDSQFAENDVLSVKIICDAEPDQGYYQFPVSLERNPLNQELSSLTLGQASDHITSAFEFDERFTGSIPGVSNLRDISDYINNATRFMKHSGVSSLALATLCDKDVNVIKALEYAKTEYNKFKSNFLQKSIEIQERTEIKDFVDDILDRLSQTKSNLSPFADSDMLGSGAFTNIEYLVDDPEILTFSLNETFSLNSLSRRSVYVYLNGSQLINSEDYEFDDTFGFVRLKVILSEGDVVEIREYLNTGVNYIPPTPSSLGLYKKFKPQKYLDDTFVTPKMVIQGHDGSITTAYNDFRDDLLLELERRIYNNIKQIYDETIFDIDQIFDGYFYKDGFSKTDVDNILLQEFLSYIANSNVDYANNNYFDTENSFTFTYSNMVDYTGTENLPGWWRGVYRYVYDTDRPHTNPWEMLGFSEKPTWWEDEYGPAPYTSGNLILWEDIKNGVIKQGSRAGRYDRYARATILNHIPVDDNGNLLSPLDSGFAKNFTLVNNQGAFALGDVAPVESGWRRSSDYPFAVVIALCLLKPFDFITRSFDRNRTITNRLDQIVERNTNSFITLDDFTIPVVGGAQTAGLFNYITDYLKNFGKTTDDLSNIIDNLDVNLSTRLSGFVDKEQQKYLLDSKSPSSTASTIFIPQENYEIYFNVSTPIDSVSYSGVILEKTQGGWIVAGYNSIRPYFEYYNEVATSKDPAINVGGVSESFVQWEPEQRYNNGQVAELQGVYFRAIESHTSATEFDETKWQKLAELPLTGAVTALYRRNFNRRKVLRLTYGTTLTTIQEVVDFLLGYQARLNDQGFVFDGYDQENQTAQDWLTSCKEFMFWTRHNWEIGSLISLSPGSQKLVVSRPIGVVDNLFDNFYEYNILQSNGQPLEPRAIDVSRDFQTFTIQTNTNTSDGVFFLQLNYVLKEHVTVFDDRSVFNDLIFDKTTGYRQDRIKVQGFRTVDWDGDYTSPGFLFDNVSISDWQPFTDYKLGDIVRYKSYNWVSLRNQTSKETFDETFWEKLDSKPQKQLISNFDYKINSFEDYFDTGSVGIDEDQKLLARHTIGYQPRGYLEALAEDPVTQFKLYQGFIREKGTLNAANKLFDKLNANEDKAGIEINEEWAIRTGQYGGLDQLSETEFEITTENLVLDPQPIILTSDIPADEDFFYRVKQNSFSISDNPFSYDIIPTETISTRKTAGYVKLGQTEFTVTNRTAILDLDITDFTDNDHVWITFDGPFWTVLRFNRNPVLDVRDLVVNDDDTVTITFDRPHDFEVGDIVGFVNIEDLIGFHVVSSVGRITLTIPLPADAEPVFDESSYTPVCEFTDVRIDSYDNFLPEQGALLKTGSKLYVDNNGNNKWEVIEKNRVYSSQEIADFGVSGPSKVGTKVIYAEKRKQTIASIPPSGLVVNYIESTDGLRVKQVIEPEDVFANKVVGSFGKAMALSPDENWLVIGAPEASGINSPYQGMFDPDEDYLAGDIVIYNGVLWEAQADVVGDGSSINVYNQDWAVAEKIEAFGSATNPGETNQGVIMIYQWRNNQWEIEETLVSPRPALDEKFGSELAIGVSNGTYYLAVSAAGYKNDTGQVYLFVYNGVEWKHYDNTNFRGIYDSAPSSFYPQGTIVWHQGSYWTALEDISGDGSTVSVESSGWQKIDGGIISNSLPSKSAFADDIDDGSTIDAGILTEDNLAELVKQGDKFGTSLAMSYDGSLLVVGAPFSDGQFFFNYKGPWRADYEYIEGDVVRYQDSYHMLQDKNDNFDSSLRSYNEPPDDSAPWTNVGDSTDTPTGKVFIYERDVRGVYNLSQTITSQNVIFDDSANVTIDSGDQFGHDVAVDFAGTKLVVSCPLADFNERSQGSAYVFINNRPTAQTSPQNGFYVFGTGTGNMGSGLGYYYPLYLDRLLAESQDDGSNTNLGAGAHVHTFEEYPGITFYMPNKFMNHATSMPPGNPILPYESLYGSEFRLLQKLLSYEDFPGEFFGQSVSISPSTGTVVVGANNAQYTRPIRYDSNETTFDNGLTSWYDVDGFAGAVYVFNLKDDTYFLTEKLLSNSDLSLNESFGFSVDCKDDVILVGSPDYIQPTTQGVTIVFEGDQTGMVRLFKKDPSVESWNTIAQQPDLVNIDKLKSFALYDDVNDVKIQDIEIVDHAKLRILSQAEQELSFKTGYDPAIYSQGTADQVVDAQIAWADKHVGKLWWDLSQVKWIEYEQGDISYKAGNWNRLAPGSSINVYEWVETKLLPSEWSLLADTTEGLAAGISGQPLYADDTVFSIKTLFNTTTGAPSETLYYYWVANGVLTPDHANRRISAATVRNLILNPAGQNITFAALIGSNSILAYNFADVINESSAVINLQFIKDEDARLNPVHREYQLISEGLGTSLPAEKIERKWIDSLVGYSENGLRVPDQSLPVKQQFGIEFRPRQSMFVDRFAALKIVVDRINRTLLTEPFATTISFENLNLSDQPPSSQLNLFDLSVDTFEDLDNVGTVRIRQAVLSANIIDGELDTIDIVNAGFGYRIAPPITIQGDGESAQAEATIDSQGRINSVTVVNRGRRYSTLTVQVRPFSVLVESDSTADGFWSIYGWDDIRQFFFRSQSQGFNTPRYWSYTDWWKTDYSPSSRITKEVATIAEVPTIDIEIGQLLRIQEFSSGGWAVFEKQAEESENILDNYEIVGRYQGTIQLNQNIYDTTLTGAGFDQTVAYDADFYDVENSQEVRNILTAVKEDIYTGDLAVEWNNLFFASIRYVLEEQKYVDWIFKTSFLKAIHNVGELQQKTNYQSDNLESFLEYIEEIKPYRTSVREFISKYNNTDNSQTVVTDFDLPAYYDTGEGKIIPVNSFNSNLDEYPWKYWADNNGYSVVGIGVASSGSGYVRPPKVIIEGTGSGATAQAYISNGRVTSIKVINEGSGYTKAPTISLVGGNDNQADKAQATAIIGNSKVRSFDLTMKFDRITKEGLYNNLTYTQEFTATGNTALFVLNYAPTIDRRNIQVLVNGSLVLDSDYTITLFTSATAQNNIIRGRILFATPPVAGSTIRVEYSINDQLLDAVNRINKYYSPTAGMKGNELEQLMTGIDFGGVKIQGTTFDVTGGWDALPWFTDSWDSVEAASDYYIVVDGSTTEITLPYTPDEGQEINIYLKRAGEGQNRDIRDLQYEAEIPEPETVRLDDPNFVEDDASSIITNPNAVMPTFIGDGSTTTVEIGRYVSTEDGDTLIFRPSESDGSVIIDDPNILDTKISGGTLSAIEGAYVTANGITAEEISIDGGEYNNSDFAPAPEENIPGQVLDSLNIKVYQKTGSGVTPLLTNTYKANGIQTEFNIGQTVIEKSSIIVYIDKTEQTVDTDYAIDFGANQIDFLAAPEENSTIEIISIGIGGLNILDFKEFSGDGETKQFLTSANYADTTTVFATINGIEQDAGFVDSGDLLDVTDKSLVQFANAPVIASTVKIVVLGVTRDIDTDSIGLVRANKQTFTYNGSRRFNIENFIELPQGSALGSTIVEVNNNALQGVDTIFTVFDGETRDFVLGIDPNEVPGTILPRNIRVFQNGNELTFIQDYIYNGTTKVLSITADLTQGDEIKIENDFRAEYAIDGNNLVLDDLVNITNNDTVTVTWFTEYSSNKFISDEFTGGKVKYALQQPPVSVDFLWVYLDGERLTQDEDFYLSDDGLSVYLKQDTTTSQLIKVFAFGSDIFRLPRAYQIYKDMLNEYYFYSFSDTGVTLSTALNYYDSSIVVSNADNLDDPIPEKNIPGIIEIGKEKIQYFSKQGNTLSQLRRGALGSSIQPSHAEESPVINVSQTRRVPYTEPQLRTDFVSDGSSILIGPLDFTPSKTNLDNWFRETIPTDYGQCNDVEVFVGGRRLIKSQYTVYDQSLHATSPDGDKTVEAEFSANGSDPFIRLTDAPQAGLRITVIKKLGSVWYDKGETTASSGVTLFDNESAIAQFIANKSTEQPE